MTRPVAREVSDAVSDPPESQESGTASGDGGDGGAATGRTRPWSLLVASVTLALGAVYLVLALGLPAGDLARPEYGFFPRIASAVLIVSAVAAGVEAARVWLSGRADVVERFGPRAPRVLVLLGLLVGYVLLVDVLGHVATSSVVAALTLRVAGERPWWQSGLLGVALGVASMILFDWVMGMRLPG